VSVHVVEHPLVHDALVTLRDAQTPPELFRRMAVRISLLLAAEATRDLPASAVTVRTPLASATSACSATRARRSRRSTIRSCRRTCRTAWC
jgi:uracil phosphoribosyltransferase